ncbi:MAG: hypothetical protein LBS21_02450 [Clostridiales bacterium]|jgi:hypothetical protein|nr:hypothetical protein [Clostridiales bacterium]
MRIIIDGREYRAKTAIDLINEIKALHWEANEDTSAEGYIAIQAETMQKMWSRKLKLPKGDTEARAIAMFEAIHAMGAWKFYRED